MIKISKKAKKYIIKLLSKQELGTNIRIFVDSPGTMYAECGMAYCDMNDIDKKNDHKFSFDFFDVYIHKLMLPFLKDSIIDLVKNDLGTKITLKAPYAKILNKSKNFSQLQNSIKNFLTTQINPKLLLHGGSVALYDITDSGVVFLKFSGGCNGCSMIDITLKKGIEKKLIKNFPEISSVEDVTHHISGKHSYY
ncbi:NfuA family Fe-S biogenesis protein [Buchnera aphidicola]|uniref:Fe/S biogenesis protein NfuA n=1 Tax=Buchnera aphidicola subsp. Cinara cedri (strain Cc) TaxID=372461 RepID=NFUA_BUCCC|nr:NfuA family Fe-S biogenesis protein [Buchnera aphidicola]Q056Z1.1 RecName: Full=Fe/S biogenesis protein NfuA [Buchnera aphidicola BCc]ABJ90808.1 GNT I transport systemmembrane-bound protein [Buchnera aphidicola BCc]